MTYPDGAASTSPVVSQNASLVSDAIRMEARDCWPYGVAGFLA
jgi:hypothetical protein